MTKERNEQAPDLADAEVLVVGLGPVGAVLAGLLGQWGVSCLVVETAREVYRLPRAAHFDDEILRVFQGLGVADEVLGAARMLPAYEFRGADGERLLRIVQEGRATASGWAPSWTFHQPALEETLRARLRDFPSVRVALGWSLVALESNDDAGALVRLACDDGATATLRGRFVVACDGGASPTRRMLGIGLSSYDFDEPWLVVDTLVDDESALPREALQICDPRRPTTMVPMSPGRRRWEFMLKPGECTEEMLAEDSVRGLLAAWVDPSRLRIERRAVYRFHGLVAERWRLGSVLLAGDAAHQMPPFLGQGMCSGIRDAAGLAWKLALVLRGAAMPALLDTYQAEREPHVRTIIETAIGMGRLVCTLDEQLAAARDAQLRSAGSGSAYEDMASLGTLHGGALLHDAPAGLQFPQPWRQEADGRVVRLDDLLGHGFQLIGRGAGSIATPPLVQAFDEASGPVWEAVRPWLDAQGREAVLVRPDRVVFGAGSASDLVEALARVLGGASEPAASRAATDFARPG
jgi:3-(3-hydroxy-phenyl)propionate hydroxylase